MAGSSSRKRSRGRSVSRGRSTTRKMPSPRPTPKKMRARSRKRVRYATKSTKEEQHSSVGQRSVSVAFNKAKIMKEPALTLYSSTANRIDANSGQQTVNEIIIKGAVSDWLNASTGQTNPQAMGWFDMNTSRKITGSNTFANVVPTTDVIKHLNDKYVMHFTNFSNLALYMKIYVMRCIKTTNSSFFSLWNDGLNRQGIGYPVATYPAGGVSGVGTTGYVTANTVDVTPFLSRELGQFWKVEKVINMPLAAASSEDLHLTVHSNKSHTLEFIQKMTDEGRLYIPGTYSIQVVAHAQCVADYTVPASPLATLGGVAFGVVTTCHTNLEAGSYKKRVKATIGVYRTTHALPNADIKVIDAEDEVDPEKNV